MDVKFMMQYQAAQHSVHWTGLRPAGRSAIWEDWRDNTE
jgi:hypothetical protein